MNDHTNRFKKFESSNCDACGNEYSLKELFTVKLSGFKSIIKICNSCKEIKPEEHYKTAASILKDIAKITKQESSPEERISKIKYLLED